MSSSSPLLLSVLISGGGRTLKNLAELAAAGKLPVRIEQVISSHADVGGLEHARAFDIPCEVVDYREYRGDPEGFSAAITEHVRGVAPDLVVLAGFLRHWAFPPELEGKVMNIHPALLPAFGGKGFYGHHVHEAVIESGAQFSGCTVHFASQVYDEGPIILQKCIPVRPDDTPDDLAARVFEKETEAYPEAIRLFAEGRLETRDGRVFVKPDS